MTKVHLIDCGLGNIGSVYNAIEQLGGQVEVCTSPEQLDNCRYLVLPGVGAFGEGIRKLRARAFDEAIIKAVNQGSGLLGICLGMQFLMEKSYEFGEHRGLGLIKGEVREMPVKRYGLRLPHIGWNDTYFVKEDLLWESLANPSCFYYLNSFSCHCSDPQDVLATYEYGGGFAAIIKKERVIGVQFHPEKSHKEGLKLLKQFLSLY